MKRKMNFYGRILALKIYLKFIDPVMLIFENFLVLSYDCFFSNVFFYFNYEKNDQNWYFHERRRILRARYGKNPEGTANSLWSQDSSSRVNDQNPSIGPDQDYSFVGMAHIFDQHVDSGVGYKNY